MLSLASVLIIVALVGLNALFVAAEFALIAAPRLALERRALAGERSAGRVRDILQDPLRLDRLIATAQLGITVASLGLGMYGEHQLARALETVFEGQGWLHALGGHALASALAVALLTYLHIVLGEMVPKAVALTHTERVVLWLTPVMLVAQTVTYPAVFVLNRMGNSLLGLFGISRRLGSGDRFHTAEELQWIVRESEEGGLLRAESASVLDELFEFGELTAREVLVPRVMIHGIEVGARQDEVAQVLLEAPHTRYPVYARDLDHIVGMVHMKDVLRRLREGRSLVQIDVRPIPFVPETTTLDTVLQVMRERRAQMVVVMDEHGGTAGLLTIEDLFEEVVGPIDEAMDLQPPELYEGQDGTLHAAGTVRVEEVGEHFELSLEHEEVDTVSGLVLALLERPPEIGDVVTWERIRLEVLEVEGHGVAEAKVTLLPAPSEDAEHEATAE
jgi:CBS domain containing-hemolysin-like protein